MKSERILGRKATFDFRPIIVLAQIFHLWVVVEGPCTVDYIQLLDTDISEALSFLLH